MKNDHAVNEGAVWWPPVKAEDSNGVYCPPMLEVAGVQVYVYVREGKLIISADFDTLDPLYFGGHEASVSVTMSGEEVWTS